MSWWQYKKDKKTGKYYWYSVNIDSWFLPMIIFLSIIAVWIAPKFMGRPEESKYVKAKLDIQDLEKRIDQYNLKYGRYPSNDEGLKILYNPNNEGNENNLKLSLVDPWGTEYQYCYPGVRNKDKYDLCSYAADKLLGGENFNQDITNWEINK